MTTKRELEERLEAIEEGNYPVDAGFDAREGVTAPFVTFEWDLADIDSEDARAKFVLYDDRGDWGAD